MTVARSGVEGREPGAIVEEVGLRQWLASGAVLEPPAVVAGLDDLAVMRETVEQRRCHFRVAEDAWPLAEGEVGRDDD